MTIVSKTPADKQRVLSQLEKLQRSEISNPPAYGSRIVDIVLNDPALYAEWKENLQYMSNRIISMRKALYDRLVALGTPGTWNHITDQIGMFSFTGLKGKKHQNTFFHRESLQHASIAPQVKVLKEKYHIYMTDNGRVSMAGLSTRNIDYFAKAIDDVVRNVAV